MVQYFRHKEKTNVTCEVFGKNARFGKWVWKDGVCSEVYTYKEVTEDFRKAFEEISEKDFNEDWGRKLNDV